jgi:uncharacterized protein (DUF1684 family)
LRVNRFRIVVALTGVLALVGFTLAANTVVRHGGAAPSLGWTDAGRESAWVVDHVDPAGPAAAFLRVGDRLLALDGDTLVAHFGAGY